MDGEARRARREARGPARRLARLARLALAAWAAGSCASMGDPPGGPPDREPPLVARVTPDSGATLNTPPREAEVLFSEVVSERVAAPKPDIGTAVLLSPVHGPVEVVWHRNRLTVRPREGFRSGRVYRLEVFPVLVDLRQNRMRQGQLSVFSTGPALPTARLEGSAVDWVAGRAAAGALIEALLLPDSLPYRAIADSVGGFTLGQIPAGEYLVYGTVDQDNNRLRGPREAYDTLRIHLADSATAELFAFPHDTTGPRIRSVELVDSLTLRLTFDRPLHQQQALDTAAVRLAPASDTTASLGLLGVWTTAQADSVRNAAAAARAAADSAASRLRADSARARAAADTTLRQAPRDTAAARAAVRDTARTQPAARDSARLPPPLQPQARPAPLPGPAGQPAARRDTTRAERMLLRRPAPSPVRLLRLAAPVVPGTRYVIYVTGARSLAGVSGDARGQLSVPQPPRRPAEGRRTPGRDSLATPTDTTRRAAAPPEGARVPPPARDTTRTPPPPFSGARR